MKNMTLANIAACCQGTYFGGEKEKHTEVTGIAIDSRKVKKGGLFFPIQGERVDGHRFIPEVMEAGALACLSEKPQEEIRPYILVDSTKDALKKLQLFSASLWALK